MMAELGPAFAAGITSAYPIIARKLSATFSIR